MVLWVQSTGNGEGAAMEFWRQKGFLDGYLYRRGESLSEWRQGKDSIFHVQHVTIGGTQLAFGFAGDTKVYFVDAIESVRPVAKRRLFKQSYDIVIEVGGREHIIMDGLPGRSADAIVHLIADYRVGATKGGPASTAVE